MFSRRWSGKLRLDAKRLQIESLEDRIVMSAAALTGSSLPEVESDAVQTSASLLSTEDWVHSLVYYQFNQLLPEHVQYLTPAQVATIPSTGFLRGMSAESRAQLNATQVQSLKVANIRIYLLTSQQIGYLTTAQIQTLPALDFEYLSPTQIPRLTNSQIASISTTAVLNSWSAASRAALTRLQVQSLDMSVVRTTALNATQLSWLTASQIQSLVIYDLNSLTPSQTPYLSTTQISSMPSSGYLGALSTASRAALTATQIRAIQPAALSLGQLTAQQISYLTVAQVQSLSHWEFALLSPAQIPQLTSSQIASIPTTSALNAWSAASRAALTVPQVRSLNMSLVRTTVLSATQISWLTVSQIRSLLNYDLSSLTPSQIPYLSTTQIASIPSSSYFSALSPAARAAFTATQIRAIRPAALSLGQLTAVQISYLTVAQVQSLSNWEVALLSPAQIPQLTIDQIASLTTFSGWSANSIAAVTPAQVGALNTSVVSILQLNSSQVAWLTITQLHALPYSQFAALNSWQIPLLLPSQFASIPTSGFLHGMPDESEAMLTRAQLLTLPADVLASYLVTSEEPDDYHPATHMPIGPDGLPMMPHTATETARFFALAPLQLATHVTVGSGDWNNPAIWSNGVVPTTGARVVVAAGTTVRFNAAMNFAIDTLRIDGKLHFATNQNTQLKVDTVVVTTKGVLHIGTEADPVQAHVTARILIADGGPIDLKQDPYQLGRGVVSRGEVRMHGMDVTPYATLAVEPSAGDTRLRLTAPPTNWRVGDRLVVTGTIATRGEFGADEVRIIAINGSEVTIEPLQFGHFTPAGYGLSIQVANLTRNVQLVAEDPTVIAERPHLVFFHNPNVVVDNISVEGFGRTDKTAAVTDPVVVNGVLQPGTGANPRARYAMHFHHTGVNPAYAPAVVRGSVVVGSPGWGFVNHSSNVDFEDNIAYQVVGAAFATEDGNEIGSMRRNLALNTIGGGANSEARRNNHDFGSTGHGFWFQGPGIEVVDNIAAGSASGGFTFFTVSSKNLFDAANLDDPSMAAGREAVPVGVVPLKQFSGNLAYAGRVGVDLWHHMYRMTDGQTYIDDFTSWGNQAAGIEAHYAGRLTIRNATLIGDLATPSENGFLANRFAHDVTFENLHAAGFEFGIVAPVRGATVVNGGYIAAVVGVYIEKGHDMRRVVDIRGAITFASLNYSQLQGRRQFYVYMSSNVDYAGQATSSFESFFAPDFVMFRPEGGPAYRLYYYIQSKASIPFTDAAAGVVPDEYIGLKNVHLEAYHGRVFAGEQVTMFNTFEVAKIWGFVREFN